MLLGLYSNLLWYSYLPPWKAYTRANIAQTVTVALAEDDVESNLYPREKLADSELLTRYRTHIVGLACDLDVGVVRLVERSIAVRSVT